MCSVSGTSEQSGCGGGHEMKKDAIRANTGYTIIMGAEKFQYYYGHSLMDWH